jgi:hypothetical protein
LYNLLHQFKLNLIVVKLPHDIAILSQTQTHRLGFLVIN